MFTARSHPAQSTARRVATTHNDPYLAAYPLRLSFYVTPPTEEITLDQFERWALARLALLHAIEATQLRAKNDQDLRQGFEKAIKDHMPMDSIDHRGVALGDQRRRDHISHFILRLAYCKTYIHFMLFHDLYFREDLRVWFVRQEVALFKYRFRHATQQEREAFVQHLGLGFEKVFLSFHSFIFTMFQVTEKEKNHVVDKLRASLPPSATNTIDVEREEYYLVPFEDCLELIQRRQVYVSRGMAYVPVREQMVLIVAKFKQHLQQAMEFTAAALVRDHSAWDDERLSRLLTRLGKHGMMSSGTEWKLAAVAGAVRADDVLSLSELFPPCMKHLQNTLTKDQHLKYSGRMQYGLFLKVYPFCVQVDDDEY